MENELARIRVNFYFSSKERLDFEEITRLLGFEPTQTRRMESFRVPEYAADEWSFSTGYQDLRDTDEPLEKIQTYLAPNIEQINCIRDKYSAKTGINISIVSDTEYVPGIVFLQDFVVLIGQIGAQVQINISCCRGKYL